MSESENFRPPAAGVETTLAHVLIFDHQRACPWGGGGGGGVYFIFFFCDENEFSKPFEELEDENQRLKNQLDYINAEKRELQKKVDALKIENYGSKKHMDGYATTIDDLEERLKEEGMYSYFGSAKKLF